MMRDEILALFGARRGHFRYESGHHGDLWLEIEPLYQRPGRVRILAAELARKLSTLEIESVCGPLVGGAFLAQMVALELDVEFSFAEQFTRATSDGLFPIGYRIPPALREGVRGRRTAIVDDVINAGSAVRGAFVDLIVCGAKPVALAALLVLGPSAESIAAEQGLALESLARITSSLWEPIACPLCAAGQSIGGVPD